MVRSSRRRKGIPSVPAAVLLVARRFSTVHAGVSSPAFVLAGGTDAAGVQLHRQRRSLAPTAVSTAPSLGKSQAGGRQRRVGGVGACVSFALGRCCRCCGILREREMFNLWWWRCGSVVLRDRLCCM